MIFKGTRTSIANKTLYFCDFPRGEGMDPVSPSGSAHVQDLTLAAATTVEKCVLM